MTVCAACLFVLSAITIPVKIYAADTQAGAAKNTKDSTKEIDVIKAPEVEVKGQRFRVLTPMPGVVIEREQSATNIQSATGKEIAESRAVNVTEFMNGQMQSVSVNDYAGNPFQQDLNFRGFTASPSIGTPQGISVYLDGVRVNEAFGEVVNWDFLPMNAIASLDLIPGSNPLFGLNTLGGALALRTKNGFTDNKAHAEYLTGSWGRQQVQASNGINNGTLGLFSAYNHFKEDGWRANSPSNVRQLFNSANLRGRYGEINLSALNVDTSLTGNGLVPFEQYEEDKKAVFTSPDENKNSLEHYNLNGRADLTDYLTVSALTYRRSVKQQAISADFYDQFPDLSEKLGGVPGLTQCPDGSNPDGNPNSANPGSGCSGLLPNGVFSTSDLKQGSKGYALQLSFLTDKHQLTTGATYDANNVNFMQGELFGEINADREVVANPEKYFDNPDLALIAAKFPVIRNQLQGSSTTKSIFFSDTWSPRDNLHFTFGARYNHTRVKNDLKADLGNALYQFQTGTSIGDRFLDPALQVCTTENPNGRFFCTKGDYLYRSFNPSIGASWVVKPELNVYGNLSRGARTPSVIELGCAIDPAQIVGSTNFQFGCSIPTSLTADPYLKQVRSTSYEVGTRGNNSGLNWNMSFFRTELKDDILFVPLGRKNRGVFDNFGETLRQGVETGVSGKFGNDRLSLNYTYLRATFESPSTIINPNNSSNVPSGAQNYVYISPGDDLPGMPRHIVQANWNHAFTPKFDVTLNMVLHSSSYVRGNENNKHEARAATNVVLDGFNRDPYDYTGDGSIPGYAVFNLRATYKFNGGFTLFAKADNLFDREYATAGNLGRTPFTPASGGAASDASGFNYNSNQWKNTTFVGPGAPRALWVGLSYDFDWNKRNLIPKNQD